ncbi:Putative glycosyltransferase EpsD [Planctomycetes bacterium Poly30]|uniref:Glycosyltransferase EpsD n=1 Tax=Saltatorellus ferox TaxID=2528018 RepID=A0A518ERT0_9BACT|nr:Putative glycosyltransferase EpsD [Planctomycetes bacterium Poly30]
MHVLHVMEATIGGTRRHLVDVAAGQIRAGLEVSIIVSTLRDPGFAADLEELERLGVHVTRIPMVREIRPVKDLNHMRQIARVLRERRPDVVHTHSSKAGVLGRRASMSTGIGVRVHTPHTFAFLFGALFGRSKRALIRSIERALSKSTQRIVAVSGSEAVTMERSGVVPEGVVRIVPNGVNPARIEGAAPLDPAEFGLDPKLPIAAVIGLVYSAKGQDLAIEAIAREDLDGLQLLFVGPGDTEELEERARALGVAHRVAFTGPRDDVPSVLATVDWLLLPSRWEGMPYVVLEAMAASLPVVATPVDGAADLVVDDVTGYLAEAISAEAIGDALNRALMAGKSRRKVLGRAGRARIEGVYTVEAMVLGLERVYQEALGASHVPGVRRP